MIKKTLPVMIGAILAGGMSVAAADVTLFGHIDESVTSWDTDGVGHDITLQCTTCSVGFKGSEDLGNGLKAIFSIDFQYDINNRHTVSSNTYTYTTESGRMLTYTYGSSGSSAITDRDQWVGLAGGFGQVRIGTISTLYKSHGAMIDPLYRTSLQGRDAGLQSGLHNGAGEELQGRATNTIRWDSADYSGFKLGATYTVDSSKSDGEDKDPYGVGASYQNGGLLAFADYMNNQQTGMAKKTAWKLGGKYDMGMFSVMGQYERFDDSLIWNDDERVWHVAGGVNGLLGMNIYVGYGQGKNEDNGQGYFAWTLAVTHDFSKLTSIYTGYTEVNCDPLANNPAAGAPLAACTVIPVNIPGAGYSGTFNVGMKVKF
jgi:predicted porin